MLFRYDHPVIDQKYFVLLYFFSILREVELVLEDFDHVFLHDEAGLELLHVLVSIWVSTRVDRGAGFDVVPVWRCFVRFALSQWISLIR